MHLNSSSFLSSCCGTIKCVTACSVISIAIFSMFDPNGYCNKQWKAVESLYTKQNQTSQLNCICRTVCEKKQGGSILLSHVYTHHSAFLVQPTFQKIFIYILYQVHCQDHLVEHMDGSQLSTTSNASFCGIWITASGIGCGAFSCEHYPKLHWANDNDSRRNYFWLSKVTDSYGC